MRTNYNSTRLNLPEITQRRVGRIFNDLKKISDRCLFMLLFIVGMTWLPAKANIPTAIKKSITATGFTADGRPYTKSADIWVTYQYTGSGADGAVKGGDQIDYKIFIRNTGDEALSGVRIVDTLPLHTIFYGASPGGGLNNGVLSWNNLTIAPGAQTSVSFSVNVDGSLAGVDYINNTGYVDLGDGNGLRNTFAPAVDNNINAAIGIDKGWPSTRTPVDNGMNSISWKSVTYTPTGPNNTIQSGDLITYVIHVQNTGTEQLQNVIITDYVPLHTGFYDADIAPDANGLLTWNITSIDPGQSVVRSFRVRVATDLTGAKAIENTAYVNNGNGKGFIPTLPSLATDPNQPDPNGAGKPSTSIPIKSVVSFEGWKIVVNSGGDGNSVTSGEELLYIIYVRNTGNVTIPLIQVSDPVPEGTTFLSATDGGTHLLGSNTVLWAVNNLAAGSLTSLHFKVKVDQLPEGLKSIDNTARLQIGGNSDTTSKATMTCDPKEAGCDKTKTVTSIKTAGKAGGLVISNVVTPNSDGKNDYFIVRGIDKYPNSALYVFNRWGGVVYQNKDYENTWDATGLSEGTYYYRLELNSPTDGVKVYKGWVMIIR